MRKRTLPLTQRRKHGRSRTRARKRKIDEEYVRATLRNIATTLMSARTGYDELGATLDECEVLLGKFEHLLDEHMLDEFYTVLDKQFVVYTKLLKVDKEQENTLENTWRKLDAKKRS